MATTSAPDPFGKALVRRSQPKKQVTHTKAPEHLRKFFDVGLLDVHIADLAHATTTTRTKGRAAHKSRGHEPRTEKRGVPQLMSLLKPEDPGGDGMDQHGAHKRNYADHAQGNDGRPSPSPPEAEPKGKRWTGSGKCRAR